MTTGQTPEQYKFKILIVDDNEHNLFTLRTLINKHLQVDVLEASSGQQAIDIALGSPDIDLIILDIQMPEMDGYQATQAIRRMSDYRQKIPIIALTANAMQGDKERCLDAGMDDYISKPVTPEALRDVLARWVGTASSPSSGAPSASTTRPRISGPMR